MKTRNTPKKQPLKGMKLSTLMMSLVVPAALLSGCGQEEIKQVAAPVIKPALTEITTPQQTNGLSFTGVVQAAKRAELAFQIGGRINEINVNEGEHVRKGQVLARLDSRDAKNALESAKLELKNISAEYKRAKAIFDRSQAISASDLEAISTRYNLAKNSVENAERQLSYTEIKAPFDGIIGRKFVDNYVQIQANAPVLALQNLTDLEVLVNIPHRVMLSGLNKTEAYAEIATIPNKKFPLSLRTYATQPDPVSQTYAVVLGLNSIEGVRVLPGMTVRVSPADDGSDSGAKISVPLTALVPDNQGNQFVWVVDENNIVQKRPVEIGSISNSRVTINRHLGLGEQVIIAGVSAIREGMEVRPYTDTRNGE